MTDSLTPWHALVGALLATLGVFGCGGSPTGGADLGADLAVNKAARCTDTFGTALTASFGRLDGTVLAVLRPEDQQCPRPNGDHVVLEVRTGGAVYRMVVNVLSTGADPDVRFAAVDRPLPAPSFAEGWHTGISLDYAQDLVLHPADFAPAPMASLVSRVVDLVALDAEVSVYATSSGGDSAHLVHRKGGGHDGAIFLQPRSSAPQALVFHFSDQSF